MSSRGIRSSVAIAFSALVVAAAGANAAPGNTVYTGTTAEGIKVKLTVASLGNATAFKIGPTEATCDVGRLEIEAAKFNRFDVSDPGAFSDKRRSKVKDGRYLLRDTFKITGQLTSDEPSWTGTYDKTTKVFENGTRVDTCVVSTTWEASA
jgi:hypothetical protein